jgi:DNA gyrase/topoisomerase IV subunit B
MGEVKHSYDNSSIYQEDPREYTRRAPSTYLGSAKDNTNLIKEIVANSIDEHIIGNGDHITVSSDTKNNVYSVKDNGQGFIINDPGIDRKTGEPMKDGKTILQRSFDTINTSGKSTDNGVYAGSALGLNGIGAKLANWLSLKLNVTSYRDGEYESLDFVDGLLKKREVGKKKRPSGTEVTWSPDPQFFNENVPNVYALKSWFAPTCAFCPNLTIEYTHDGTTEVFHEPEGLPAYVSKKVEHNEVFPQRFITNRTMGDDSLNICITMVANYDEHIEAFVNLGATVGGAHLGAFKTSFVRAVNKCATDLGLLKKSDKNFTFSEVSKGLYVVFNMTTASVRYEAQNKSIVDDIDASIINAVIGGDFATWLCNNQDCLKMMTEKALQQRKEEEEVKKIREKMREVKKGKGAKALFTDLPTKLSDAYPKDKRDRSKCELMICEGDSAVGSINAVKDSSFQASFPIRGKILNCKDVSASKILQNGEVMAIIKSLGLSMEDGNAVRLIFDEKKLRYSKIIITTDADADGSDIAMLLITVFHRICPELIYNGYIYRVYGALYKVTFPNGEYILFQNDAELNKWREKNKSKKYTVARAKGLGEMSQDDTYDQLVNPATRNLKRLVVKDEQEFEEWLELVKGSNAYARKDYLYHGSVEYDGSATEE